MYCSVDIVFTCTVYAFGFFSQINLASPFRQEGILLLIITLLFYYSLPHLYYSALD